MTFISRFFGFGHAGLFCIQCGKTALKMQRNRIVNRIAMLCWFNGPERISVLTLNVVLVIDHSALVCDLGDGDGVERCFE